MLHTHPHLLPRRWKYVPAPPPVSPFSRYSSFREEVEEVEEEATIQPAAIDEGGEPSEEKSNGRSLELCSGMWRHVTAHGVM